MVGATPEESAGSAGLRLNGYRKALDHAGIPFDPALIAPCDWRRDAGAAAVAGLLDSGVTFDAVFGLNDVLALGAMHELLIRGVKVPQEVAVAGFDDIDEARFAVTLADHRLARHGGDCGTLHRPAHRQDRRAGGGGTGRAR